MRGVAENVSFGCFFTFLQMVVTWCDCAGYLAGGGLVLLRPGEFLSLDGSQNGECMFLSFNCIARHLENSSSCPKCNAFVAAESLIPALNRGEWKTVEQSVCLRVWLCEWTKRCFPEKDNCDGYLGSDVCVAFRHWFGCFKSVELLGLVHFVKRGV